MRGFGSSPWAKFVSQSLMEKKSKQNDSTLNEVLMKSMPFVYRHSPRRSQPPTSILSPFPCLKSYRTFSVYNTFDVVIYQKNYFIARNQCGSDNEPEIRNAHRKFASSNLWFN